MAYPVASLSICSAASFPASVIIEAPGRHRSVTMSWRAAVLLLACLVAVTAALVDGALLPELASAPGSCSSNLQPCRRSSSSILFCARTLLPSSVHARPIPPALGPRPRCRCSPTAAVLLPAALALVAAVEFFGVCAPSPSSPKSPLAAHSVLVDAVPLPML
ncbi:hypothetical protein ZEAMMB73_Zm00001d024151 [Zea mays]|uniref:Uncharacterized protein n=1 Tax=Zea mays TaxID=4577 RepID=K7TGM9_MAIZE|nr:hypothetical protein ZEAMMB73_Zm00001d024151 [Zea mays]